MCATNQQQNLGFILLTLKSYFEKNSCKYECQHAPEWNYENYYQKSDLKRKAVPLSLNSMTITSRVTKREMKNEKIDIMKLNKRKSHWHGCLSIGLFNTRDRQICTHTHTIWWLGIYSVHIFARRVRICYLWSSLNFVISSRESIIFLDIKSSHGELKSVKIDAYNILDINTMITVFYWSIVQGALHSPRPFVTTAWASYQMGWSFIHSQMKLQTI